MKSETLLFSDHLKKRMVERSLKKQWILITIESPDKTDFIADDECHFFRHDERFNHKWLKVVVNPEDKIIVTAYFDRNMKMKSKNEDYLRQKC